MNLIIDVGNTRIKTAVFKDGKLIHYQVFTSENFIKSTLNILEKYPCNHGVMSSVGNIKKEDILELQKQIEILFITSKTKVPFKNKYTTPDTLGVDRIALVAEAVNTFPKKNVLIIDAGTCITYDYINDKGHYKGGAISPGIKMRYKSLHAFTQSLPRLELESIDYLIGNSTSRSIHSGVINGAISEIDSVIYQYRKKNKDLTVVLTGGDVNFLSNNLKNGIFANPHFLLRGLNTILTYNL